MLLQHTVYIRSFNRKLNIVNLWARSNFIFIFDYTPANLNLNMVQSILRCFCGGKKTFWSFCDQFECYFKRQQMLQNEINLIARNKNNKDFEKMLNLWTFFKSTPMFESKLQGCLLQILTNITSEVQPLMRYELLNFSHSANFKCDLRCQIQIRWFVIR